MSARSLPGAWASYALREPSSRRVGKGVLPMAWWGCSTFESGHVRKFTPRRVVSGFPPAQRASQSAL